MDTRYYVLTKVRREYEELRSLGYTDVKHDPHADTQALTDPTCVTYAVTCPAFAVLNALEVAPNAHLRRVT